MEVLFVLALLLVPAVPAWAEEEDEDTVEIDEVVVTATRTAAEIETISSNVTVITEDDINNSTAATVQELLRKEAGVFVSDLYGSGTKSRVDMRGFVRGMNTLIMLDGRRLNEVNLSGVDWNLIPLENVERIEVVRGSGSVLYGDNANAGVINIITKRGTSETPEFELGGEIDSLEFEDFDGHYEYFSMSGATGMVGYSLFGKYHDTKGYRENSDLEATDINATIDFVFSDSLYANLRGGYHDDEQGYPSYLTLEEMEVDRTQSTWPDDGAKYDQYFYGAALGYTAGWGELELAYDFNDREYDATELGSDSIRDTETDELKLKGGLSFTGNILVAGIDYNEAEAVDSSLYGDTVVVKTETGLYIQDAYTFSDLLTLTLGYRYAEADVEYTFEDLSEDGDMSFEENALKGGLAYNYSEGAKFFASYSTGYRLPTTDEFFVVDPDTSAYNGTVVELDPELSKTFEVGILHPFADTLSAGLTLYEMRITDEHIYNPDTGATENLDDTLHRGAEVSLSAELSEDISLMGSFTYTDATFEAGEYEDNTVPLVPEKKVSLAASYGYEMALFSVGANWVDERYQGDDLSNSGDRLDDYITVDMRITATDENGDVFIGVDNMLDEEYVETATDGYYYPAPGRRYYAGMRIKF
jgi:iron complex outermembrane receptor protein